VSFFGIGLVAGLLAASELGVMRFRNATVVIGAVVIGAWIIVGLVAAASGGTARRVPQVSLVHLTSTNANPPSLALEPFDWSAGSFFGDPQEMWNAEFEVRNPEGSGVLLSHDKVEVEFIGSTGDWTVAVSTAPSQALTGLLARSESTLRITMMRVRASIPSETRRCRLVLRLRPLTPRERCRQVLVRSGFWRRFPKASAWISERLPITAHWREWRPEIELPRVLIEQGAHNQAPAPNHRPRFPLGGTVSFVYLFCAPPASPAAVGEARRWL